MIVAVLYFDRDVLISATAAMLFALVLTLPGKPSSPDKLGVSFNCRRSRVFYAKIPMRVGAMLINRKFLETHL